MKKELNKIRTEFLSSLKIAFPIMLGYFTVAIAFGLLARTTGLRIPETAAMSFFVFAGASQFAALKLLSEHTALLSIILATFFLNLRHLLMSASLALKWDKLPKKFMVFLSFGVTDETFTVISSSKQEWSVAKIAGLEIFAHLSWFSGSIAGHLFGQLLPLSLQKALGLGLYSLFITLLVSQGKTKAVYLPIALVAGGVNCICIFLFHITPGFSFVISMLTVALAAALLFPSAAVREGEKNGQ